MFPMPNKKKHLVEHSLVKRSDVLLIMFLEPFGFGCFGCSVEYSRESLNLPHSGILLGCGGIVLDCLNIRLWSWGLFWTSPCFNVPYMVRFFDPSQDSGPCRTGLFVPCSNGIPNHFYVLRLNVPGYTMNISQTMMAEIYLFSDWWMLKRLGQLCQNKAWLKNLTTEIYNSHVDFMQIMKNIKTRHILICGAHYEFWL